MGGNPHGRLHNDGDRFLFDAFEVDAHAREVRKHSVRIKVHGASFEVLLALLESPGQVVTREELRKRLWPDGTFVEFDNNLNSTMNRLREALNDSAEQPRYIETLPRVGYRFVAAVEKVVRETDTTLRREALPLAALEEPGAARWRSNLIGWRAAAGLLIVAGALTLFGLGRRPLGGPTGARAPGPVAVLAFQTPDADDESALGLVVAEDLRVQLSGSGLRVLPRSAAFRYRKRTDDAESIARALGAGVVTGRVMRRDGQVWIEARLLWPGESAASWTRSTSVAESELATATSELARELRGQLAPGDATAGLRPARVRPTANAAAYEDYLEGLYQLEQRTAIGITKATDGFELATRKDPQFAAAHAALATAYAFDLTNWRKAEATARRALEIDPRSSEARAALGFVRLFWERDWKGAQAEFQNAVDLNSQNATARHWYALYLMARTFATQAKAEIDRAHDLDPFSPAILTDQGQILLAADRLEDAARACRQALALAPDFLEAEKCLYRVHKRQGRHAEANQVIVDVQQRLAKQLIPSQDGYIAAEDAALEGRTDEAMRHLENALAKRELVIVFARVNPAFRSLRKDPRFLRLLDKLGLGGSYRPEDAQVK